MAASSVADGVDTFVDSNAFAALQHGGCVEFGPDASCAPAGWRVRLVVPVPAPAGPVGIAAGEVDG